MWVTYARQTSVSPEKTKAEIEKVLVRFGASEFMSGWDRPKGLAIIGFVVGGRMVRIRLNLPSVDDFRTSPKGRRRTGKVVEKEYEQACRARWRSLLLVVKAKLVAVDDGIASFEEEFLAHLVLPNDKTVGEFMVPQLNQIDVGKMPRLLPEVCGE